MYGRTILHGKMRASFVECFADDLGMTFRNLILKIQERFPERISANVFVNVS